MLIAEVLMGAFVMQQRQSPKHCSHYTATQWNQLHISVYTDRTHC